MFVMIILLEKKNVLRLRWPSFLCQQEVETYCIAAATHILAFVTFIVHLVAISWTN